MSLLHHAKQLWKYWKSLQTSHQVHPIYQFPLQHIVSSATHQIQGFLVQLTLPPLSVSYIQEGWSHQWPCTCLACPGGAILHESLGSFCCRQSLQMYWSKTPHLARWWGWTGGQPPVKGVQPQASRGTEHERFWALFLQWKLRIIKVIPESISFCKISWVTGDRCRTATSNCFFPSNTFEVSGHVLCSVFIYPSSSQQSSFQ